jgi:crossover junction endodeoxyribonuclease RuvC
MVRLGALRPARVPAALRESGAKDLHEHLCRIHQLVSDLIEEFAPHNVAVESVFTALNRQTALRLAEVRGVVLLAAAQKGVPVRSYSPREIKSHVSGYGNAGKEQMQQMVRALLGLAETPEPADAADALAVALCHIQAAQAESRMAAGLACGGARKASRATSQATSDATRRPGPAILVSR